MAKATPTVLTAATLEVPSPPTPRSYSFYPFHAPPHPGPADAQGVRAALHHHRDPPAPGLSPPTTPIRSGRVPGVYTMNGGWWEGALPTATSTDPATPATPATSYTHPATCVVPRLSLPPRLGLLSCSHICSHSGWPLRGEIALAFPLEGRLSAAVVTPVQRRLSSGKYTYVLAGIGRQGARNTIHATSRSLGPIRTAGPNLLNSFLPRPRR